MQGSGVSSGTESGNSWIAFERTSTDRMGQMASFCTVTFHD